MGVRTTGAPDIVPVNAVTDAAAAGGRDVTIAVPLAPKTTADPTVPAANIVTPDAPPATNVV